MAETNVTTFPRQRPQATARPDRTPPARRRPAQVQPAVSFALWVRGLPRHLQPEIVAQELIATRCNATASPIWARRKRQVFEHLRPGPLSGPQRLELQRAWREAVRMAGVMEKARRRQAVADLIRIIDADLA